MQSGVSSSSKTSSFTRPGGQVCVAGSGEIVVAGRQLNNFVKNYPQNFHYLNAP